MPQVKIFGLRATLDTHRTELSRVIHTCLVEALGLPEEKRFQRFIALEPDDFVYPDNRTDDYLIIEINLMAGRSQETRKQLVRLLMDHVAAEFSLHPNDVEILLVESPRENWGIRGQHGDELELSYRVDD